MEKARKDMCPGQGEGRARFLRGGQHGYLHPILQSKKDIWNPAEVFDGGFNGIN